MVYYDGRHKFWGACYNAGITEPEAFICQLYTGKKMSCREISEWFVKNYQIKTTPRNIEGYIKKYGIIRNRSEARHIAIKNGRVRNLCKTELEKYKAKQIPLKLRMEVLERDKFKCCICGNSRKTGYSIEIHHIEGEESVLENLQTLCYMCHKGLHYRQREAK